MKGGVRAYARHRKETGLPGADPMAVEKAIRSGRISRGPDGEIDFEKADRDWKENTTPHANADIHRENGGPEDEDGGGIQSSGYRRARAVREFFQARLAEIEYKERIGELISKAEVQTAAFNKYRRFRDRILNVPDRVAAILATETDMKKVHEILTAELRYALEDAADSQRRYGPAASNP